MKIKIRIFLLLVICYLLSVNCQKSNTIFYDSPELEKVSNDFEMFVNNKPIFIYQARVSKYPINQIWPGYQRPLDQTEIASFTYFDFNEEVTLKITSTEKIKTLDIRPKDFAIAPVIKGNVIEFKLSKPSQFVVEINGYHNALHVFANSVKTYNIEKEDPKIHYFGPGVHEAGLIDVKSNETVFIDGGAIVYGVIQSKNTRNIRITGRGMLDASKIERGEAPNLISLEQVTNATIDGIILRDAHQWAVVTTNCDSIAIDNIKLIGFWRYNSDGIDIVNSKNISIKNSFIRSFDDNIAIKGLNRGYNENFKVIENIVVENCILWNDWGRALEIGAETVADTIRNITFSNCHIIHFTAIAMDVQNSDKGIVKNIRFKDITIEDPISDSLMIGKTPIVPTAWGKITVLGIYGSFYSHDSERGNISNIYFNNIQYNPSNIFSSIVSEIDCVRIEKDIPFENYDKFIRDNIYFGDIGYTSKNHALMYFSGYDSIHNVTDIYIENFQINGEKLTDMPLIGKNEFVKNVFFE